MKLKTRTERRLQIARPKVRLTDAEILADLLYPVPVSDDTVEHRDRDKRDGTR